MVAAHAVDADGGTIGVRRFGALLIFGFIDGFEHILLDGMEASCCLSDGWLPVAQTQGVCDDEEGAEAHAGGGDHRI